MNTPKKRGLGRGLDALLGVGSAEREGRGEAPAGSVATLPVDLIQRGRFQPRRDFNAESLQ